MAAVLRDADPEELTQHADAAARLLKALANPYRLQILCVLNDGEMSVGALNDRILLSQSALSQHLKVLRSDGLVKTRRKSQTVYYRLARGPAMEVIAVLHRHFCGAPASAEAPAHATPATGTES
jgi:ArsR family transcriptional regulator, virulence genes transcriptional regulator